jgi:hypothetical protein
MQLGSKLIGQRTGIFFGRTRVLAEVGGQQDFLQLDHGTALG